MLSPQSLLEDGETTPKYRLSLREAPLPHVHQGQIVEREADIGVVGTKRLFANGEVALLQEFGFWVSAFAPLRSSLRWLSAATYAATAVLFVSFR